MIGPYGLLSSKARLLVTNSIAFLKQFDKIVYLRRGVILEQGSYKIERAEEKDVYTSVTELEKAIENDLKVVSGKVVKGVSSFTGKAEKFSKKIHDIVEDELKEFFEEITV